MAKSKKKKGKVPKQKRKLTAEQRRARRERKRKYKIIFINGRQKRVPREPTIEGLPVDEFIARNADPIWLHQQGLWHLIPTEGSPWPQGDAHESTPGDATADAESDDVRWPDWLEE